ncbi:MAG: TolC family protein [Phycisphaerales bacterium]
MNNPGLEASFHRWYAEVLRVPQLRALPDPRLTFGVFVEEVETAAGPQTSKIGLSQTFPWFGELQAREDAAASAANAAWREYESRLLDLRERVITSLHELAYLDRAVSLTEENLELLGQFEQIARTRYRVATGSHPELIRIQVDLGRLESRLEELRDLRGPYLAKLNAALNRPVAAPAIVPADLPSRVYEGEIESLVELAGRANPSLLAMEDRAESQRALERAARAAGHPDITLGIDYTFVRDDAPNPTFSESGDDPVLLTLGLTLPLDREKYDSAVREAGVRRLALGHERAERLNALGAELRMALFEHRDAHRLVELYEHTLIPKASESLSASLGGFRVGEQSMLDLLETQRTLLEFQVALERARADRAAALATLERLAGAELEARPVPTEDDR